jgi:hypothetical protein
MSAAQVPYCKTSTEAFAPSDAFPNGYRRVADECSFEQKLLHLQEDLFKRMEATSTALAVQSKSVEALGRENGMLRAELDAAQRGLSAVKG